ncbi:diguanylate cyclase domain-containing protein, partial [Pseudomonas sp. K2I15]|uniref:diguanylate cyclase domain-containing protein n=1 Tax=Pseudomonas sp. K2I15 TaxID=2013577 RepID=UPI002114724B
LDASSTRTLLLSLSTIAGTKISNPSWVNFQSAGWVSFQSAPTYTGKNANYEGLGVSIGITETSPSELGSVGQILSRADVAMYNAKSAGKNCFRFG